MFSAPRIIIQPQSVIGCLLLPGLTSEKYSPLQGKRWAREGRCLHPRTWTWWPYAVVLCHGIRASALHGVYRFYFLFSQVAIRTEAHTWMLGSQNITLSGKLLGGNTLILENSSNEEIITIIPWPCTNSLPFLLIYVFIDVHDLGLSLATDS